MYKRVTQFCAQINVLSSPLSHMLVLNLESSKIWKGQQLLQNDLNLRLGTC